MSANFHYWMFSNTCNQLCIPILANVVMGNVDTYNVFNILFVRLVPNQRTVIQLTRSQPCNVIWSKQSFQVEEDYSLVLDKLPQNLLGKSLGLILDEVEHLDYHIWSLIECGRKDGRAAKQYYWWISFKLFTVFILVFWPLVSLLEMRYIVNYNRY